MNRKWVQLCSLSMPQNLNTHDKTSHTMMLYRGSRNSPPQSPPRGDIKPRRIGAHTLPVRKNVLHRSKYRCQRDVTWDYLLARQANLGCSMIQICIYPDGSGRLKTTRVASHTGIARGASSKALPAELTQKLTLRTATSVHITYFVECL